MTDKNIFAGIDIGGTNIKFGLFDETGKILHKESRPTMADKGAQPLLHLVTNIAERLLFYAAEEEYDIRYLGVGTPGAVNFKTGQVIGACPNIKGWQGVELGKVLKERLNIPIFVDNDVNAMALAETKFGIAKSANSVVCCTIGTGVGGAIIINGKLWRGANYTAGELGHMSIKFDSEIEHSGMFGSIEGYCASKAIIGRLKKLLKKEMTPVFEKILEGDLNNLNIRKLFTALKQEDDVARQVVDETAHYLGVGLAGVVNLLNPESVVIGGGITEGGGGFVEAVAKEIKKYAFDSAIENIRIVRASLGNDAGFIGAGLLGEIIT